MRGYNYNKKVPFPSQNEINNSINLLIFSYIKIIIILIIILIFLIGLLYISNQIFTINYKTLIYLSDDLLFQKKKDETLGMILAIILVGACCVATYILKF